MSETAEGIFAAELAFVHASDFGNRCIILEPTTMGKAGAANESLE